MRLEAISSYDNLAGVVALTDGVKLKVIYAYEYAIEVGSAEPGLKLIVG
jgi:hypothetical protein